MTFYDMNDKRKYRRKRAMESVAACLVAAVAVTAVFGVCVMLILAVSELSTPGTVFVPGFDIDRHLANAGFVIFATTIIPLVGIAAGMYIYGKK